MLLFYLANVEISIIRVDLCFQLSNKVTWNFRYIEDFMFKKDM